MSLPYCCLTRMDPREETLGILNKIWVKLHGLANANPVDQGAFFIILTFICEFSAINHYLVWLKEWAANDAVFICTPLSDSPAHGCAALRELLLPLLRSQDGGEGVDNLKKNSKRNKNIFTSHIDSDTDRDISASDEDSCRVCSAAVEEPNPQIKTHIEGWPDWLPNTHTVHFSRESSFPTTSLPAWSNKNNQSIYKHVGK